MAEVRIRLKLDQGLRGARLTSLATLAVETQKLLRMVGEDVGIASLQVDWIATDFQNDSLAFTVASTGEVDDEQATDYRHALERIRTYDPRTQRPAEGIRNETLVQYARVAQAVEASESLRSGVETSQEKGRPCVDCWRYTCQTK